MTIPQQQPQYQPPVTSTTPNYTRPVKPKGLAMSALIVGIVAFMIGLVPFAGAILGAGAIVLGAIALIKSQSKGLSITGLSLGSVALIVSLITTVAVLFAPQGVTEISAAETTTEVAPSEEISKEPADEEPAASAEEPKVEFETLDSRQLQLIVKNPEGSIGKNVTLYASVFQFDTWTGPCSFLGNAEATMQPDAASYTNVVAVVGDENTCGELKDIIKGDHVKFNATVAGSYEYQSEYYEDVVAVQLLLSDLELLDPIPNGDM